MIRHKVKFFEKKKAKLEEAVAEYEKSAVYIKQHKMEFVKAVGRVFIQIFIYHSIPYFVYKAFGLSEMNFLQLFSMQAVLYTTVSGIPLPGSIGVSESLFLKLFGSAFGAVLSGAMLLYRFVSFYLYIIIFSVVVIATAVKTKDIENEIDKNVKEIEADMPVNRKTKLSYT